LKARRKLHDSAVKGIIDDAESVITPSRLVRIFEIDMIEQIERFRPDVQPGPLGKRQSLDQG
jgi:hypothetical protein